MTVLCLRVGPPVQGCTCPFCKGMRTLSELESEHVAPVDSEGRATDSGSLGVGTKDAE